MDVLGDSQSLGLPSLKNKPCINFAQGTCKFGTNCRYLHDPSVQPDSRAIELYQRGELGSGVSAVFKPCNAFAMGNCTFGDRCRFSHNGEPPASAQAGAPSNPGFPFQQRKPCFNFQRGLCNLGDTCTYSHDPADNSDQNSILNNKKPCFTFKSTGFCARGESCKFSHSFPGAGGFANAGGATGAFAQALFANVPAGGIPTNMGQMLNPQMLPTGQAAMNFPGNAMSVAPSVAFHPVIFAGHFGRSFQTPVSGVFDVTDKESSEPLPENDDCGPCAPAYEVSFGQKAFFLEGIHVVPRGVQPPSVLCCDGTTIQADSGLLTGQTSPENAPFELEMLARNIDTNTFDSVCRTSITGGVQWLPFVRPHNTIAINHLIFRGSFDTLTIMIHGGEIDPTVLSEEAGKVLNAGKPVPEGWRGEGHDARTYIIHYIYYIYNMSFNIILHAIS